MSCCNENSKHLSLKDNYQWFTALKNASGKTCNKTNKIKLSALVLFSLISLGKKIKKSSSFYAIAWFQARLIFYCRTHLNFIKVSQGSPSRDLEETAKRKQQALPYWSTFHPASACSHSGSSTCSCRRYSCTGVCMAGASVHTRLDLQQRVQGKGTRNKNIVRMCEKKYEIKFLEKEGKMRQLAF